MTGGNVCNIPNFPKGGVHFQRRKVDRGAHFQRVKMDRGSILHSEKGPGVTFAIFLTFRGGSSFNGEKLTGGGGGGGGGEGGIQFQRVTFFQRVKMDRGVHFQRVKMDRGSIFYGGPFSISHRPCHVLCAMGQLSLN